MRRDSFYGLVYDLSENIFWIILFAALRAYYYDLNVGRDISLFWSQYIYLDL